MIKIRTFHKRKIVSLFIYLKSFITTVEQNVSQFFCEVFIKVSDKFFNTLIQMRCGDREDKQSALRATYVATFYELMMINL